VAEGLSSACSPFESSAVTALRLTLLLAQMKVYVFLSGEASQLVALRQQSLPSLLSRTTPSNSALRQPLSVGNALRSMMGKLCIEAQRLLAFLRVTPHRRATGEIRPSRP